MTRAAAGTVKVISTAATPPAAQASAMRTACSELSARTTATSPESMIVPKTFSFIMYVIAFTGVFGNNPAEPGTQKNGSPLRAYLRATSSFNFNPKPGFSGK